MNEKIHTRSGFLTLSTVDILSQAVVVWGERELPCALWDVYQCLWPPSVTSGFPDSPHSCDNQNVTRHCQLSSGGQNWPWLRIPHSLANVSIEQCLEGRKLRSGFIIIMAVAVLMMIGLLMPPWGLCKDICQLVTNPLFFKFLHLWQGKIRMN